MDKALFKRRMDKLFEGQYQHDISHQAGDDLMIEALEGLGYDVEAFKSAPKWYGLDLRYEFKA